MRQYLKTSEDPKGSMKAFDEGAAAYHRDCIFPVFDELEFYCCLSKPHDGLYVTTNVLTAGSVFTDTRRLGLLGSFPPDTVKTARRCRTSPFTSTVSSKRRRRICHKTLGYERHCGVYENRRIPNEESSIDRSKRHTCVERSRTNKPYICC